MFSASCSAHVHPAQVAFRWPVLLLSVLGLFACKGTLGNDSGDAGGAPVNLCATKDDAFNKTQCQLTAGQDVTDYIRSENDQDWYSFTIPSSITPRTLIHVTAAYRVPYTPVNLVANLLQDDGLTSLVSRVDNHGQGLPHPLDMLVRYTAPGRRVLLTFSDQADGTGRHHFDAVNPFTFRLELLTDPNPNDPNNVVPTPITTTNQGGILVGSTYGYLVTDNELHKYTVTIAPFSGRKILYLNVTQDLFTPPPPYRLAYRLLDPAGVPISEDHAANVYLPTNLATARLIRAGTYEIDVFGYKPPDSLDPVPGDITKRWNISVMVLDDLDPNEPNDSIETATRTALSATGQTASFTGRLAYVPDTDWYEVDLPANSSPTLLHYQLVPLSSGGRFPPLPTPLDRQVRVFTLVSTGTTQQDRIQRCKYDPTACPKGYQGDPSMVALVEGYCDSSTPPTFPKCLQSSREEAFQFPNLRNFEGALNVPPHSSTVSYFFLVQDQGNNFADDKDLRLTVDWLDDPDEASRYVGGVKQTTVLPLAQDTANSFPVPPPNATVLSGTLSYGFGRLLNNSTVTGSGVRGPTDYDSIVSDVDRYELDLTPGSQPQDQTWELQWVVAPTPGNGGTPYELSIALEFCDGDRPPTDGGTCTIVNQGSRGDPLVLAYTSASLASWHGLGPLQPVYDRDPNTHVVTGRAYGGFCIEPRFVRGGKFFMNVGAVDRNSYLPRSSYTIRTAYTSYPQSYPVDGGTRSLPPPVLDGGVDAGVWLPGCQFTHEP